MNTTAAALQAHVTTATIRIWARRGVIAATKEAGRWFIDAASLAHRIAIAAMRTRKAAPVTAPAAPAKPEFVPHTLAEFFRDRGDVVVRVQHYPNKDSFGDTLFTHRFPFEVSAGGGFLRAFNDAAQAACEAALIGAGWATTSEWTRRRAATIATVTAA